MFAVGDHICTLTNDGLVVFPMSRDSSDCYLSAAPASHPAPFGLSSPR
jgi:hypothetical protein